MEGFVVRGELADGGRFRLRCGSRACRLQQEAGTRIARKIDCV